MDKDLIINLYKQQFNIICLYLIKCGCRPSDVEDIVQDSFIKVIEYITEINIKNLPSWLFKVSINNYKNMVRRGKVMSSKSIYEDNFYEELVDNFNLEENIINKEKSQKILQTLNLLKEEYKSLIILKYEIDLSYKEISILLGLDENTIKVYLYRARNSFKKEWNKINEGYR